MLSSGLKHYKSEAKFKDPEESPDLDHVKIYEENNIPTFLNPAQLLNDFKT